MDPRQLMRFIDLGDNYWLRLDQIASVQPHGDGCRVYQIKTGFIESTLAVEEVMDRIREATNAID